MTVLELVDRERARLRRMHLLVGLALAIGATCLAPRARRIGARQRAVDGAAAPLPFLVWLLVIAADVAVVTVDGAPARSARDARKRRRGDRARTGDARRRAARRDRGRRLRRARPAGRRYRWRAPGARWPAAGAARAARVRRGAAQATGAATVAMAALAFAVPNFNDGLLAIFRPVSAWNGHAACRASRSRICRRQCCAAKRVRLQIAAPRRGVDHRSRSACRAKRGRRKRVAVDRRTGVAAVEVGPLRGDLTHRRDRRTFGRATPRSCT